MSLVKQKILPKKGKLTLEEGVEILDELREGKSIATLATLFNVYDLTIHLIKQHEDEIRNKCASARSSVSKRTRCKTVNVVKMEESLATWVNCNYTDKRIPLDNFTIRLKAMEIYNQLEQTGGFTAPQLLFSASNSWLENFKKRFGLNLELHKEMDSHDLKFSQKPASTEADVIETISEPHIDTIVNEDSENCPEKSSDISITDVKNGLKLAKNLEHHFMEKDSSLLRKRIFQDYLKIALAPYFKLLKTSENKMASFSKGCLQNVSSDEPLPIRRKKTRILENDSNRDISNDEDDLPIPRKRIRICQPFQDGSQIKHSG